MTNFTPTHKLRAPIGGHNVGEKCFIYSNKNGIWADFGGYDKKHYLLLPGELVHFERIDKHVLPQNSDLGGVGWDGNM